MALPASKTFAPKQKLTADQPAKNSFWKKIFGGKPENSGIKFSKNTIKIKNYYRKSRFEQKTSDSFKIFKPSPENLLKEKVRTQLRLNPGKKFTFGNKNLQFVTRTTNFLQFGNLVREVKFYIVKWRIIQRINQIIASVLVLSSVLFLIYLTFFDTIFLVKSYAITFTDGSYLDNKQVQELTQNIRQQKLYGIFPNNQYWFLNSNNLTVIAKSTLPEIKNIEVVNRNWPNEVELKIQTEPILLTLGIVENSQKKYWRINQLGKVLSEDDLNLRENLVEVEKIVSFDRPGASLKDYPLEQNKEQLNRFWFVLWLWEVLKATDSITIVKTTLPTILDTDVEVMTLEGTRLLFDSASIPKENQKKRIANVLNSQRIQEELKQGKLAYIDFRIPKKVFVCRKGTECEV